MLFSISSISAEEIGNDLNANEEIDDVAIETTSNANYDKEIYVNTTTNPSGDGGKNNPYDNIKDGISKANSSDNAVIYLGEGTFNKNNLDNNLEINLAHKNYNGSLTFIGAGYNKTFLDGNNANAIFSNIGRDSIVTFKNISFINGKNTQGGAIVSEGALTIENCIFENNYATSNFGGAIWQRYGDYTIKDSIFKNNSANTRGGAIYSITSIQNAELINNTFVNNYVRASNTYGAAAFVYGANFTNVSNNKFINSTGNGYDAVLYINSVKTGNIINNVFINCTNSGTTYAIIYLGGYNFVKNNTFINSVSPINGHIYNNGYMNLNITYEDAVITSPTDITLKATVTDDMGNLITGPTGTSNGISFYYNNTFFKNARVLNGTATAVVTMLINNGIYTINGTNLQNYKESNITTAKLTVNIDQTPIDLWVNSNTGNDGTGDGSQSKPFKTINHAIVYGFSKSFFPVIHINEGTFSGVGNTNISANSLGYLTLIGESYNKTIIDGDNSDWFLNIGSDTNFEMINLTFTKGYFPTYNRNIINIAGKSIVSDCIFYDNVHLGNGFVLRAIANCEINNSIFMDNIGYVSMMGIVNNSHFENIVGGGIYCTGNLIVENSKFINNSRTNGDGGAISRQSGQLTTINNTFKNNIANQGGAIGGLSISKNDIFIGNSALTSYGAIISNNNVTIINAVFYNNSAIEGGALGIRGGQIINSSFEENKALTYGGAIYIFESLVDGFFTTKISSDSRFKNNFAGKNGEDIYLSVKSRPLGQTNGEIDDLLIRFNDLNIVYLADTLSANISHQSGALIGGGNIKFYLDDFYLGESPLINGVATLEYIGFENGTYTLSGQYIHTGNNPKYIYGNITVDLSSLINNVTIFVSDGKGNDVSGIGTFNNPFKTIKKALYEAYKISDNITIRILEGNYFGEGNVNLLIPTSVKITISGDGPKKTIINGSNMDYFFDVAIGLKILTIANLTFTNGCYPYGSYPSDYDYPAPIDIPENVTVIIDNVHFIGNHGYNGGALRSYGTVTISNSYFLNNGDSNYGGAIYNAGVMTILNSKFVANAAKYSGTIHSDGNLYFYSSHIEDSLRVDGFTGSGGSLGGHGNLTVKDSSIIVTGKMYSGYQYTMSIISTGNIYLDNVFVDGYEILHQTTGYQSYNTVALTAGSGTANYEVYNSTFVNTKYIIAKANNSLFENCVFESFTTFGTLENPVLFINVTNSIILGDLVSIAANNHDFNNNWWGSNDKPVFKINSLNFNPDSWIILNFTSNNAPGYSQLLTLSFMGTDGSGIYKYNNSLPTREFKFKTSTGNIDPISGDLNNKVSDLSEFYEVGNFFNFLITFANHDAY
ncbi:MAG: hypothetical protein KO202_02360 [Methanobacteriaceae archaeon]|jgi:predicted outer membrane repeat protein|nr:hypothetical protein [Methanobacteriaceae archaeon]